MSGDDRHDPDADAAWAEREAKSVVLGPVLVWVGLIALLAVNVGVALSPLGAWRTPLNIAVALVQVGFMAAVLMRLDRSSAPVRLAAFAGLFWLSFLFIFSSADYLTRV